MGNETFTNASLIIQYLELIDVEYAFSVYGDEIGDLSNEIDKSKTMQLVFVHSQSAATYMAEGYYKETGKLAAVFLSVNMTVTNIMSGLNSALNREIPLLLITVNTPITNFEASSSDIVSELNFCSKMSTLVSHTGQLEHKLINAIMTAKMPPYGGTHLCIPSDILLESTQKNIAVNIHIFDEKDSLFDQISIANLCEELKHKTFCIYLGEGASTSIDLIMNFINTANAYFVSGVESKGCINERHPLYRGVYNEYGHLSAKELLLDERIDYVLVIGKCFDTIKSNHDNDKLLNKTIHFDFVESHFVESRIVYKQVYCHLKPLFLYFLDHMEQYEIGYNNTSIVTGHTLSSIENEGEYKYHDALIHPSTLMSLLSDTLSSHVRIYSGLGKHLPWVVYHFLTESESINFNVSSVNGDDWAIATSIGANLFGSRQPTICFINNLSYFIASQEIKMAVDKKLPIVFIFLNTFSTSVLKDAGDNVDSDFVDLEKEPESGCNLVVIKSVNDLEFFNINALFYLEKPTLLNIWIDPVSFNKR